MKNTDHSLIQNAPSKHVLTHYTPPREPWLDILYEDETLLVLNKQSGLLSVPGKNPNHADCLESRAREHTPDALLIHRLDMETSGVFIMARNKQAQRHLGFQFEKRNTEKTYIARIAGHLEKNEGTVDLPLICDWPNRPKQMVCHTNGKQATTHWKVTARRSAGTLTTSDVTLTPITGRSHQLRVHMLAIGHPILGDSLYAPKDVIEAASRLQLHAQSLTIMHPKTKEKMTFEAPAPF